jgi:molybdenum cofactor cytidylyltransferase
MPAADAAPRDFLSGIILAAGASTRIGRPKQLLPLDGRPVLQRVLDEAAASCLDEVIVVLGCRAPEIEAALHLPVARPVRVLVNPDHAAGQSTSLRVGLRAAQPQSVAAAILLADQPGVTAQLIDRLAAAFRAGHAPVVRPVYRDAAGRIVPGHPVFLARRLWADVETLRGDQGARALLAAHPDWVAEVLVEREPPADIDTWADYRRAVDLEEDIKVRAAAESESRRTHGD